MVGTFVPTRRPGLLFRGRTDGDKLSLVRGRAPTGTDPRRAQSASRPRRLVKNRLGSGPLAAALVLTAATAAFGGPASSSGRGVPPDPGEQRPRMKCGVPQGEPLPAAKLLKDLAEGRQVELSGRVIDGNIDADLIAPAPDDRKVSLRHLRGRLRLDSCRITGRILLSRTVMQDLTITCSEVLGDIDLTESEIRGSFTADRSRLNGDVRLPRTRVEGDISIKDAVLEDGFELQDGSARVVTLRGSEVRRNIDLTHAVVASADISSTKVGGLVKLEDVLALDGVTFAQGVFDRSISIESSRIRGPLIFRDARSPAGIYLAGVGIDGNLLLSLTLDGPLVVNDVALHGDLLFYDGNFKDVSMARVQVDGVTDWSGAKLAGKVSVADTDFGKSFTATETLFTGETEFRKVRFAGDDPLAGALFASSPSLIDTPLPHPPRLLQPEETDEDDEMGDANGDTTDDDGP
jgi:hypothetical protein